MMKKRSIVVPLLLSLLLCNHAFLNAKKSPYGGHEKEFDYIIVGFGSAGAILARKLSDNFKHSVLVLEAGPNNMETPETLEPNFLLSAQTITFNPDYSAIYPVPLAGTLSALVYSEGREWGGSAAHNYLLCVRGLPSDYDSWAINSNNSQWLFSNILPLMRSLETYTPDQTIADPTQRGFNGPIFVTQNPPIDQFSFAQTISAVTGSPMVSDYNLAQNSIGVCANQIYATPEPSPDKRRSFSAFEFMKLGEIMDEKGRGLHGRKVRVMGNAEVTRLLFDDSHCTHVTGVQYLRNKESKRSEQIKKVYARKKVILCAGSINTPKLLMQSGIGDRTTLENLGIKVVVDSPHVGQHLQDGYGCSALVTGPAAIPGGFFESYIDVRPYMPADGQRRIQIETINLGPIDSMPGKFLYIMYGFLMHPQGEGSVEIVSKDPLIKAKLNEAIFQDGTFNDVGSDAYLEVSYFKIVKAIADAAGETVLYPTADQYAAGDAGLFAAAANLSSLQITFHNSGTTRLGTSIQNGVVDGNLHVFGTKNLMVADCGIENPIVHANTCWSAYMIGLVAAKILGVPTPPAL